MTLAQRIVPVLAACASTGWLMVAGGSAQATARPEPGAHRSALACVYKVHHVRRSSFLNVRSGPGLRYRPIGRLTVADGRFGGSCDTFRGWVKIRFADGGYGWASARYLRKVSAAPKIELPELSCAYRLTHVRKSSFLNVRSGPGLRHRPIGRLTVADGHFAGACGGYRGWVAVRASNGKVGWAFGYYLSKLSG